MDHLSREMNSLDILTLYLCGDGDEAVALLRSDDNVADVDIEKAVNKVFDPLITTFQYPKLRLVK